MASIKYLFLILCLLLPLNAFAVGTWTYDESDNIVVLTFGTAGAPATFTDFVTADRAGTAELTPEDAPVAFTQASTISLTYAVRPVEDLAVILTFTISGSAGLGAGDTINISGDDWDGNNHTEQIVIAGGDDDYVSTKKYSTIDANGITFTDNAGGGFSGDLSVTQGSWGVIWDYGNGQYRQDCRFNIGDNSESTYFKTTKEQIIFPDGILVNKQFLYVRNNATFQSGELVDLADKVTSDGTSFIDFSTDWNKIVEAPGTGVLYLYSSLFNATSGRDFVEGATRIWNCSFVGDCFMSHAQPSITPNYYNVTIENVTAYYGARMSYVTATGEGLKIANCVFGIYMYDVGEATWKECKVDNSATNTIRVYNIDDDKFFIDCVFDSWGISDAGGSHTKDLYRQNTVNIHVVDKDGNDIPTANIDCNDTNGTDVFNINTDASGDTAEQTVTYQMFDHSDSFNAVTYSPHTFVISKTGYRTQTVIYNFSDGKVDWEIELDDGDTVIYDSTIYDSSIY